MDLPYGPTGKAYCMTRSLKKIPIAPEVARTCKQRNFGDELVVSNCQVAASGENQGLIDGRMGDAPPR